ncbi:MAG: SH3 domain-containing protein [Methylophilaceae bacterium]|nr:SH3 domain-containing protein [Methylophilaceae bacterium]
MKLLNPSIIIATILWLPGLSLAAEFGTALKTDTMRSEPYADAKTTGNFARGEKLEILSKKGAWLQIKTSKNTGWVRLLSIKRGAGASGGSQISGVLGLASGRAGTGQVVATTGVRGLSEEELKHAEFNENEISKLEQHMQSAEQAQKFASQAGLKAVKFNYLPKGVAQ